MDLKLCDDYYSTQAQHDEAAQALEFLEGHPERRLFSYAYLDDKYGFLGADWFLNLESFRRARDQEAYDVLMQIVERNRTKV